MESTAGSLSLHKRFGYQCYGVLLLVGRVANGTFWRAQELTRAIGQVFNCNPPQFDGFLRYSKDENG